MSKPFYLATIIVALTLSGCGGLSSSDDPDVNDINIIDTSGSDSATDPESEISISSSENSGEFVLYWDIETDDDYTIDISINDENDTRGGLLLFSDFCDPDDACHDNQTLECEFQSDLELICEDSSGDEETVDIGSLGIEEDDLPEDLYFILKACDPFGFDCEDQSLKVSFE